MPYIVGVVAEIRIMFDNKANEAFGPDAINVLINTEETAAYLAKKFGIPDNLVRDEQEREQILALMQQMQQSQAQAPQPME